jgi:hypothetical protein
MRFMISYRMPTEKANQLIREGKFGETFQSILEDLNPEAVYLTDVDGARGGYLIVNVDDASQLPGVAEPLFFGLGATVKIQAVLNLEDAQKAIPVLEQVGNKYG